MKSEKESAPRYGAAIKKAIGLRHILGLDAAWFPIVDVIEFLLPQVLPEFQFEIVELQMLPGKHALAYPKQQRLVIREDVYNGACDN
ncbi:MAG: hypothetical protein EXR27_19945 [Betaproteobacteria bacterium]|nr:hypothetical protein [Betaproteobacteria bacterium]